MTIKILIPEQKDEMGRLDQWKEKRGEIKGRFPDNIGRLNISMKSHDIETVETKEGEC